jgi:hypothetical protein
MGTGVGGSAEISALIVHSCSHAVALRLGRAGFSVVKNLSAARPRWVFGGYPFVMIFLAGVISTQPGRKETNLLPMELRPWTKTASSRNPAGSRRPSKPPGPACQFLSKRAAASSVETWGGSSSTPRPVACSRSRGACGRVTSHSSSTRPLEHLQRSCELGSTRRAGKELPRGDDPPRTSLAGSVAL